MRVHFADEGDAGLMTLALHADVLAGLSADALVYVAPLWRTGRSSGAAKNGVSVLIPV